MLFVTMTSLRIYPGQSRWFVLGGGIDQSFVHHSC